MSAPRTAWQNRWQVDPAAGTATHETGLCVRLVAGVGVATNAEDVAATLVPTHGAHNAPAMVARLMREGAQMLIDPYARGWRGVASRPPG